MRRSQAYDAMTQPSGGGHEHSTTLSLAPALVGLILALSLVAGHLWMLGWDASVFVRAAPPLAWMPGAKAVTLCAACIPAKGE